MTPEQFGQYMRDDIANWSKLAKERNIQISDSPSPDPAASGNFPHGAQHQSRGGSNAPPVTRMLGEFVAKHPSQGWDASVEREAHRTLQNWVGCAIGASHHTDRRRGAGRRAGTRAERAGDRPGPQRARRHRQRGAAERHHVAHVRLRRHAPQDDHPSGGTGRIRRAGVGRASRRERPAAARRAGAGHRRLVPRRQHDLSRPLRPRLAHHRIDRDARRRSRLRAAARARRGAAPRWRWALPRRSRSACANSSGR